MAVDFPSSPSHGAAAGDRSFVSGSGTWDIVELDPPDPTGGMVKDTEYARVGGAWRKRAETYSGEVGSGGALEVTIPSNSIRLVRYTEVMYVGPPASGGATEMTVSVTGSTFVTGASAYGYLGPYHNSGSTAFATVGNAAASVAYLTNGVDNNLTGVAYIPHTANAFIPLFKPNSAAEWYGSTNSQVFSSPAANQFVHTEWKYRIAVVAGGYQFLAKLRLYWGDMVYPSANSFVFLEYDYV